MPNQFRRSIGSAPTTPETVLRTTYAKPSNLLTLGALLLPLVFGWVILAKPYSPVRKIIYGALMALSAFWILGTFGHSGEGTSSDHAVNPHWVYQNNKDQMRGTSQVVATIDSVNQLQFDAPYGGGSTGTLIVIPIAADDHVIRMAIDKGQFNCALDNELDVKVDNKLINDIKCYAPEDGSTKYVGFRYNNQWLYNHIKGAHKITIEAPFYQSGRQQLTFLVSGLNVK